MKRVREVLEKTQELKERQAIYRMFAWHLGELLADSRSFYADHISIGATNAVAISVKEEIEGRVEAIEAEMDKLRNGAVDVKWEGDAPMERGEGVLPFSGRSANG